MNGIIDMETGNRDDLWGIFKTGFKGRVGENRKKPVCLFYSCPAIPFSIPVSALAGKKVSSGKRLVSVPFIKTGIPSLSDQYEYTVCR